MKVGLFYGKLGNFIYNEKNKEIEISVSDMLVVLVEYSVSLSPMS